jgi:hypothetical protein
MAICIEEKMTPSRRTGGQITDGGKKELRCRYLGSGRKSTPTATFEGRGRWVERRTSNVEHRRAEVMFSGRSAPERVNGDWIPAFAGTGGVRIEGG